MKISFIIAIVAFAASVSAQTASDIELGTKWCQVYNAKCIEGSNTHCGSSPKANTCVATFENNKCTQYNVHCSCTAATGVLDGTVGSLKDTFAATEGACADLKRVTIPNNGTSPTTTGAIPTSARSSPTGTAAPEKGNSAGKTATNAFLAVVAAVGAAALAV
ncbi:hypothetical protein BG006_010681 [Podila minutissima]|uniref:Uncharacterized protein n=1 Tax=Podila minutissima TaxID=64525 RepID=A0A9P5SGM6_9FUNG|nr:hypothetical protein BG006_010681 [Podila minutissima]